MKQVLVIIILLFLCFLFVVYFLSPRYSDFKVLRGKVFDKESLLQEREAYFLDLEDTSKKLEKYEESLKKISSALPDTPSIASLLSYLQKKSSENGLILESLGQTETSRVGTKEDQEEFKIEESHLSLNLIGGLFSLENFLKTLEKSSRMIEVEKISLKKTGEELLEINLSLKVHSY